MKKKKINDWIILSSLDSGGSGEVYIVKKENSEKEYVLKQLKNIKNGRLERFNNEIAILNSLKGQNGIVTIIDDYLSSKYEDKEKWYVVEKGITLKKILEIKEKEEPTPEFFLKWIFEKYIELLDTLNQLNDKGIYHRDIKPENIVYIKEKLVFIDFGISNSYDQTDKNLTEQYDKKQLGAKFYMAPEMRRNPASSDHSKVDIYSITKTIWATITKEFLSFDGQYNQTHDWLKIFRDNISNTKKFMINIDQDIDLFENISKMFELNTADEPNDRLSICETKLIIRHWIDMFFIDENKIISSSFSPSTIERRWSVSLNKFFQRSIPIKYLWESENINYEFFNIFNYHQKNIILNENGKNKNYQLYDINVKDNRLILTKNEINKSDLSDTLIFDIKYNRLKYFKAKHFSYFYYELEIINSNDFIIIIMEHMEESYHKYYINSCRGFPKKFLITSEDDYFNSLKYNLISLRKHLLNGCPYCKYDIKGEEIYIDYNDVFFTEEI